MSSIKELMKKRILVDMIQSVQPPGKWKIIVVDPKSIKILNTACRMHDILEENVTLVEDLTRKRQPYPTKEAIYFISPVDACVDRFLADFDKGKAMYAAAHIFFVAGLPDHLFEKIKTSAASAYVKTLKEMNVDFIAYEPQVFTFEQPLSLFPLYNPQAASHQAGEITSIAQRIISVLSTLGDYPYIRYYSPQGTQNTVASKLAHRVQQELDDLCRLDPDFPPPSPYKRSVLVIVDRALDMVSPLVHEFTYQAMMNDLLVLEGGKYIYKTEGGASTDVTAAQVTSASLDDNDPIWMLIRHWHYADAVEYIRSTFNKFLTENRAAATAMEKEGGDASAKGIDSLKQMKDTLSSLPQFQEMKSKFSVHINICQECKTMFERRQLDMDLATGESVDGRAIKFANVMMDMVPALDSDNVSPTDKLRLLMLYIITQHGIEDDERRRLLGYAKLSVEDSQAITNLSHLGVRLSKSKEKSKEDKDRGRYTYHLHNRQQKRKGETYDLSRWSPVLKTVLQDQIRNQLDSTIFPWITEPPPEDLAPPPPPPPTNATKTPREKALALIPPDPSHPTSLRTTRASWSTPRKKASDDAQADTMQQSQQQTQQQVSASELRKNGPRIILFSLGGLTFSELRATYEVIKELQRDVIIGTTHIYNPIQLVEILKDLGNATPSSEIVKGLAASTELLSSASASVGKGDTDHGMSRSSTSASLAREGKEKGIRGMFSGKKKDKAG
ncbi:hypothetical protein SpCBS45565_g02765 [Spizellomyces sp. 'palustris']|nr:hypothetical protein SpCBS45565_g02765 [Spizellomyces sp. 'palustris']